MMRCTEMWKRNALLRKKVRNCIIVAAILVASATAFFTVKWAKETYNSYVQSRAQLFMISDPSSKKLFHIAAEKIEWIRLIGKYIKADKRIRKAAKVGYANLKSDKYIEEVVNLLNSFEFTFVRPGSQNGREDDAMAAADIYLFYGDDELMIINYNDHSIKVNGFWYYGDSAFFEKLCAIGEKYAQYSSWAPEPVY